MPLPDLIKMLEQSFGSMRPDGAGRLQPRVPHRCSNCVFSGGRYGEVLEQGIKVDKEFSGDGNEGDFGGFAMFSEGHRYLPVPSAPSGKPGGSIFWISTIMAQNPNPDKIFADVVQEMIWKALKITSPKPCPVKMESRGIFGDPIDPYLKLGEKSSRNSLETLEYRSRIPFRSDCARL